ncbi:MAG: hypothetical protein KAR38_05065 [Calditrichia bacterium]|nr:hypothetical protein [Calditrichia bacterium]
MNKTIKILLSLVGILALSNIAILYFLFTHRPLQPGEFFPPDESFMQGRKNIGHDPTLFKELRKCRMNLMNINRPIITKIRHFDKLIYQELLNENPDKDKIYTYLDSAHIFSKEMKDVTIQYFLENKDSLSYEQKKFLLQNLLKKHVHKPRHRFKNKMKGKGR